MSQQRITRDDLEAGLRNIQTEVEAKVSDKRRTIVTAAGAVAVILILLVFLMGRRSGSKKTTLVEIRRL